MYRYEALDIETLNIEGVLYPFSIAITNNKDILYFQNNVKDIKNADVSIYLLNNCSEKKIYYAHNLTFEAFVLLRSLIDLRVSINGYVLKGSCTP